MNTKAIVFGVCAGTAVVASAASDRPEKPNVIMMLADDLGWQDVACYDVDQKTPYETPNMDALAKKGVLFRQAYSPAPTCSPSRCAIMSGKHPARIQKTHVLGGQPPAANREIDRIMPPWFRGSLAVEEVTLAEALRSNGYKTGHSGKWHIAISHNAYPQPKDHGFDVSSHGRGVCTKMAPDRLTGFATKDPKDPYRLNDQGIPTDEVTVNAIDFIDKSKNDPFFLYYATWLVHYPIQSRSKQLLEKYCQKLGVEFPTNPEGWPHEGQKNPYYCAMIEMLDTYIGQLIQHLEQTDDPRWPGHKLIENTYIIFSSDNGGCEGGSKETYTDNAPLDMGKGYAKEGGTRVPLIILGPGIKQQVDSNVLANGIDFYPTILSWTNTVKPAGVELDGCDLSSLLAADPTDAAQVVDSTGKVRNSMIHHFPHGNTPQSSIRIDGYKFIYNYFGRLGNAKLPYPELELYKLYDENSARVDIEEAKNLAKSMPEKVKLMKGILDAELKSMDASMPYLNPRTVRNLPGKDKVCTAQNPERNGRIVSVSYKENGAKVTSGYLMYTLNGGEKYEEWLRTSAELDGDGKLVAELPEGATHYLFNLIDENGFLVSYPQVDVVSVVRKKKINYSSFALEAQAK